ncbi:MAG: GMC family oxidoreductase [Cyanobacteria bacterium J06592_8]
MSYDFDAIIIGSGAGGGTVAFALATAGKRVLLVERGPRFADKTAFQDEQRMLIEKEAFDDRIFEVNGHSARLHISGILGGGTSLYGGVLIRPSQYDFHPGKYYSEWLPRHLWDWPIAYDDLAPYYDKAEQLMQVSGDSTPIPGVETPTNGYPCEVPALAPINQHLETAIAKAGFTPFHLPFGIDFNRCLRCPTCPGFYCPNDARASTTVRLLDQIEPQNLQVRTLTEATRLLTDSQGKVIGVQLRDRETNQTEQLTAKVYILSAGAIGSPAILLKSGLTGRSDQVGRNYMFHCGALAAGFFVGETGGADSLIKQLGFTDLYLGSAEFPHKLGLAQTVPVPGPLSMQSEVPFPLPTAIARFLLKRMLVITGLVEDLPQTENRVELGQNGEIRLTHRFHPYDVYRSKYYMRQLRTVFRHAGAVFTYGVTGDKDEVHTSHQAGTTRFGTDPQTSVLDPDCRLHDHENVFVVDGGFMPNSLGVSPALTIMANALRVSEAIKENC